MLKPQDLLALPFLGLSSTGISLKPKTAAFRHLPSSLSVFRFLPSQHLHQLPFIMVSVLRTTGQLPSRKARVTVCSPYPCLVSSQNNRHRKARRCPLAAPRRGWQDPRCSSCHGCLLGSLQGARLEVGALGPRCGLRPASPVLGNAVGRSQVYGMS